MPSTLLSGSETLLPRDLHKILFFRYYTDACANRNFSNRFLSTVLQCIFMIETILFIFLREKHNNDATHEDPVVLAIILHLCHHFK